MRIVKTTKAHMKDFVRIGGQYWTYEWVSLHYFENTLSTHGFHFTALIGKNVVGSIMVVEEDYPRFSLYFFAVDKNYQRKGIGTALLKKAESKMKKGTFLFLDTEKEDRIGIRFYKKNGFRAMGKVKNWFGSGRKGIILAKEIR